MTRKSLKPLFENSRLQTTFEMQTLGNVIKFFKITAHFKIMSVTYF